MKETNHHHDGKHGERHANEEDPAPVELIGQPAADHRPGYARNSPDRAEEALDARPLLQGEKIAEQGENDRCDGPRAQALDRPHGDQLPHALRHA